MIEDVAVLRIGAELSSAHAGGLDRRRAKHPVRHVDVVDVLFNDVIAGEPGEVEPVAQLPLGVGPRRLTWAVPQATLIPEHLSREHLADRAVLDTFNRVLIVGLMPTLGADADGESLLEREFVGREHRAHAGRIHGHRLLRKNVLAGLGGGRQMCRAEVGRCREDHQVHVGGEHLFVGVKAGETFVVGDLVFGGERRVGGCEFGQLGATACQPVRREVTHGHQFHTLGPAQAVFCGTGAAATAANQPDTNHIRSLTHAHEWNAAREGHQPCGGGCGGLNKSPAVDLSHRGLLV